MRALTSAFERPNRAIVRFIRTGSGARHHHEHIDPRLGIAALDQQGRIDRDRAFGVAIQGRPNFV